MVLAGGPVVRADDRALVQACLRRDRVADRERVQVVQAVLRVVLADDPARGQVLREADP